MSNWNFDKEIDRHNTCCMKYDGLEELFGRTDLLPLWIADMDFAVNQHIADALSHRFKHHIYGYSRPRDEYWQSIIDWEKRKHNFRFTREDVTYVPGIVKGIALAVNYFTEKGDKIVIQPPVYHPFKMVIEGNKRVAVNNPLLRNGDKYSMDFDGLEKIFSEEKPKMMILCNPHNPIGIVWSKETLAKLAILCKKYNVLVVSDEIHGDLAIFGHENVPFATACPEAEQNSVTFGAPSKTFNIPGLVSSWVVVKNPEIRQGFFDWLTTNEFNEPTFVATLATEVAYTECDKWLDATKEYIEDNIRYVEDYCSQNIPGIHPIRPEASFLLWLDCSGLKLSHDELISLFVDNAHLALNDGEMFGSQGAHCMRLNVGTCRKNLTQALEQLKVAITKLKK